MAEKNMEESRKKKPEKKRSKFSTFLYVVSDLITIPILLISLITAFTMFNAKKSGYVPSLFGRSIVTVISGSMIKPAIDKNGVKYEKGFNIGDTVIVHKVNISDLKVNDIIAFYEYVDQTNIYSGTYYQKTTEPGSKLDSYGNVTQSPEKMEAAAEAGSRVIFHQIIEIVGNDRGVWFKTKGTSNSSADSNYLFQYYVIGVYQKDNDSPFLRQALSFMSSRMGIIVFAIIPCGICLMIDTLSLIEQIDELTREKRKKREEEFLAKKQGLS